MVLFNYQGSYTVVDKLVIKNEKHALIKDSIFFRKTIVYYLMTQTIN